MFRVTRYPMISKTESGRVGYWKKYRVAGRVRVPAGHWLQHWLMAGVANEEGEDGFAVKQHVDNQVDIKQVTWSPGRPPPRPAWPPLSPRRLCGGALWRERLLWSEGIRWEECIWWGNHFNPLNLFVLVHKRHCQRYQVFILTHFVPLPRFAKDPSARRAQQEKTPD